jgi:6-phosphogluconolactonase/glucosamine-6-phosphate isomerase/deaminase
MKKIVSQEQSAWVLQASDWLQQKQIEYKAKSVYLPAGETPKKIYSYWQQQKPPFLDSLKLIQIDDVMTGQQKHVFRTFFKDYLPYKAEQIEYFETGHSQADLGILGLGMNGHVAFHEPDLNPKLYSGCVKLQDITIKNLNLEPNTWGKSYGAGAFNQCKALLLIVNGEKKKAILQQTLNNKNNPHIPASLLLNHPDLTILTDFNY